MREQAAENATTAQADRQEPRHKREGTTKGSQNKPQP
nr:MAG TPA: hypothetical protein [Caudoviricetes sp.]